MVTYRAADPARDRFPTAIPELIRYFRESAPVEANIGWNELSLGDLRILQSPMLYMTGHDGEFQLTEAEKRNLGGYLKGSGFLFAEDIRRSAVGIGFDQQDAGVTGTTFDRQFKELMADPLVLGANGVQWETIPRDHPLYTTPSRFPDGPPLGGAPGGHVRELEMLQRRGRVVVVFSDLNISWYWGDSLPRVRRPGMRFGVNLIVFAMSQRGYVPIDRR